MHRESGRTGRGLVVLLEVAVEVTNLADVTERLLAEFEGRLDLDVISHIVLEARHQLAGSPVSALPELVERLARVRLLDLQSQTPTRTVVLPD